jgi:hypothetical protein
VTRLYEVFGISAFQDELDDESESESESEEDL